MAKFSSPPAGPLAAGLERDFCRCRLEVLHLFENFTRTYIASGGRPPGHARQRSARTAAGGSTRASTHAQRALHFECREAPVAALDVETRGLPPLAPPPRVCGEVYLTLLTSAGA